MPITVKYFARLREQLGRSEEQLPASAGNSVGAIWKAATGNNSLPDSILVAVNLNYAKGDTPVQDGDEVGFFPPVTGG